MTSTEQETRTEAQIAQEVHADVYDVLSKRLEELRKEEPKNGGDLCSICKRKGCRIGPMMRG
jgi:hypothetical protein